MWGGEVCDKKSELRSGQEATESESKSECWSKLFVGRCYNCSFFLNSVKLNTTWTSHLILFWPILVPIALFAPLNQRDLGDLRFSWFGHAGLDKRRKALWRREFLATILLFPVDRDSHELYNAQCDYKIWRRPKIHGGRTLKTETLKVLNHFELAACVLLDYSTTGQMNIKEIRKPKKTKKVWFYTFLRFYV